MAGRILNVFSDAVALTTSYEPILQLESSANVMLRIKQVRLSADDLTIAPVEWRYTIGGTAGTGTSATLQKQNPDWTGTVQGSAQKDPWSADPTGMTEFEEFFLGPGGFNEYFEINFILDPGDRFTIWAKGAAASGNVRASAKVEE